MNKIRKIFVTYIFPVGRVGALRLNRKRLTKEHKETETDARDRSYKHHNPHANAVLFQADQAERHGAGCDRAE